MRRDDISSKIRIYFSHGLHYELSSYRLHWELSPMLNLLYIPFLGITTISALLLPPTGHNVSSLDQNLTITLPVQNASAPDSNFRDIVCRSPTLVRPLQWSENIACESFVSPSSL